MSNNPCQAIANFYEGYAESKILQKGVFGGIKYSAYIESNGSAYQVECVNTIGTFKTTGLKVQQRLTGQGYCSIGNVSTTLYGDGKVELVDLLGNRAEIKLPIPDKKK